MKNTASASVSTFRERSNMTASYSREAIQRLAARDPETAESLQCIVTRFLHCLENLDARLAAIERASGRTRA